MTFDQFAESDLGDGLNLREIIGQWAYEFTGRPNEAVLDVDAKLRKLWDAREPSTTTP